MPRRTDLLPCIAIAGLIAGLLAGCASKQGTPDNEPTLKTLAGREVTVSPDQRIEGGEARTIAAYKRFLEAAPAAAQAPDAMRRLGDLEMDSADNRLAADQGGSATGAPDYRAATAQYRAFLAAYPRAAGNDRVLYQLARAQEQGGELEAALKTLDRLVAEHPASAHRTEAQFRRGELLFTTRDYSRAEQAYAVVIAGGPQNPYHQRALYMQGWSQFKQGRLEDGLRAFFGVLDLELASGEELSRARRELVEDTFRVASISFANLQGAASIAPYIDSELRRGYEHRVYQQLAELYIKQDRVKDAADTFGSFVRRQPLHPQAPLLQARVIEIYQNGGFATLALDAKRAYVSRYGPQGDFRQANPAAWAGAQPRVKAHLSELARHHHAGAQKTKSGADVQEAVRWYRAFLEAFPADADAAQNRFLLAELLFEDGRFAEAAAEYETTAYGMAPHARSADAGYAALLAQARQISLAGAAQGPALQRAAVTSALRFSDAFPTDPRVAGVLADAADTLHALRDTDGACALARRVLALVPHAAPTQRRVAWTVLAHAAFEQASFDAAEKAYAEVLALTPEQDAARPELVERLAAAVYKQGEAARGAGRERDAVGHFERVATAAPQSAVRANAQYDAAAALIGLKDWPAAARALEDFRQRYPGHPLAPEVAAKLALAYLETGRSAEAAAEFERIAAVQADPQLARAALWQAAELYDKAGQRGAAAKAYERYLRQYAEPLEPVVEARWRLAALAKADGSAARELAWLKELFEADRNAGTARTERTRALGASAALALARPASDAYRQVALVEPLAKQLALKKARMKEVLDVYALAAGYGVAEVTTAATHDSAALYQDFGRALLDSQRPKRLSKRELEQYNVMLEEQAFPFEEKAIELHEANARRAAQGVYDAWVKRSFAALAGLRPARYAKAERGADVPAEGAAALEQFVRANPRHAPAWNRLGMAHREGGRFVAAREAYEQAIAIDTADPAPLLNLAILTDLYFGDAAQALVLYDRWLAAFPGRDPAVVKWVADLKNRRPNATVARKEPS